MSVPDLMSQIKEKKKKNKNTTKPQKQQTTLGKAHLFSISEAGMVPKELALLKSYPVFLYPTSQLFKESIAPD